RPLLLGSDRGRAARDRSHCHRSLSRSHADRIPGALRRRRRSAFAGSLRHGCRFGRESRLGGGETWEGSRRSRHRQQNSEGGRSTLAPPPRGQGGRKAPETEDRQEVLAVISQYVVSRGELLIFSVRVLVTLAA